MILSHAFTGKLRRAISSAPASAGRWGVPVVAVVAFGAVPFKAQAADLLQSAGNFAVLAGSTVTNTNPTFVTGDIGVWPGTAITDPTSGIVLTGSYHSADAAAQQAQADLTAAYTTLTSRIPTQTLTGQNLGGKTLTSGTYFFASSADLTGSLVLDGGGDYVFQIGSTLTTATNSSVMLTNGASAGNVYWQVTDSATLGTGTVFKGSIVALTSITLNTNATIVDGRALARNGAVTMDTNRITVPLAVGTAAPEPASEALFLSAGLPLLGLAARRRIRR